jgi:Mg2+ and Co2+ transporter CorA
MFSSEHRAVDDRMSYRTTLVHSFQQNGILTQKGIPTVLFLLYDLYRLILSEWVAVHIYIERDLNTIEWRLETERDAKLEVLESFLQQLIVLKRRIFKYQKLLDEKYQSILSNHRPIWDMEFSSHAPTKQMLEADFLHVEKLCNSNATRVNQILSIIIPLISIRDGKATISQNRTLGYLTILATFLLPFNAIAAILAIPKPYGPNGDQFWIFWISSVAISIAIASILLSSLLFKAGRK